MDGFVESPPTEDIAALARRKRVPFVEDLGSGAIVQTQTVEGMEHEPTPAEVIRARRRSGLLQRRQAARRPAGRHHRRPRETGRRAQAGAAVPRAALRQADSVGARSDGRSLPARRSGTFPCSRCCTSPRRAAQPRRTDHRRARWAAAGGPGRHRPRADRRRHAAALGDALGHARSDARARSSPGRSRPPS